MDKEELKENIERSTPEEELNTQSTENDNSDHCLLYTSPSPRDTA